MRAEPFDESAIGRVQKLVIGSEPGPVVELLDLGATVHRLWVTGGDGVRRNVVHQVVSESSRPTIQSIAHPDELAIDDDLM